MGKPSRQRRNQLRMTQFNILKSRQEKENQLTIANLRKEIVLVKKYHTKKHEDTLEFYKKELSLQKDYYNLMCERLSIKFHRKLCESESIYQSLIQELVHNNENYKRKLLQIDKTIGL